MKHKKAKPRWLKILFVLVPVFAAVLVSQNCSDVRLGTLGYLYFGGKGLPFDIMPPTDYKVHRRVVVMVDMSNSMVSGPCPYDVDNGPYAPMFTKDPHVPWDPNKQTGDPRDGRAIAYDCQVRTDITPAYGQEKIYSSQINPNPPNYSTNPPSSQFGTYLGIDPGGDRLTITQTWLDQLNGNLSAAAKSRVKVSIIPVTGGKRQTEMLKSTNQMNGATVDIKLRDLSDPELQNTITTLKNANDFERAQVMLPDYFRWKDTKFGTTAPGDILDDLYRTIRGDMETLNSIKALPFARYEVMYLSDGRVRPQIENFKDALKLLPMCGACASDPATCKGLFPPACSGDGDGGDSIGGGRSRDRGGGGQRCVPANNPCADLVDSMRESWGNPEPNSINALELEWSLIEGMPRYYGGGLLKVGLVKLKPALISAVSAPAEQNSFDVLAQRFKARGLRVKVLEAPTNQPPVAMANPADEIKVFKLANMFIYHNNVRIDKAGLLSIDTDGDGLFDYEEAKLGTNPYLQRSNDACLDIIATNPAYKVLCEQFAAEGNCGFTFDADHDDLNECEERALGTDDRDFDTDGDGIPDSLEVIYGFSPTIADTNLDTNGDGYPNVINFSAGIPPQIKVEDVPPAGQMRYRVDYMGSKVIPDEDFVQVRIDQYAVNLDGAPTAKMRGLASTSQGDLFLTPKPQPMNRIDPDLRLLGFARDNTTNIVTALARIIDPREPEIVYWRLYRMQIPATGLKGSTIIDNSAFKLLPAVDYDGGGAP